MKRIIKTTALICLLCLLATSCGKGEKDLKKDDKNWKDTFSQSTGLPTEMQSETWESENKDSSALRETTETAAMTPTEKRNLLGCLTDLSALSNEEMGLLCQSCGMDNTQFEDKIVKFLKGQQPDAELGALDLIDSGCTTIILAADGAEEIAKRLNATHPEIVVAIADRSVLPRYREAVEKKELSRFLYVTGDTRGGFYLMRGTDLYSLSASVYNPQKEERPLYLAEEGSYKHLGDPAEHLISCGTGETVPTLQSGDLLVYYSAYGIEKLELYPAELSGYTVRATHYEIGSGCFAFTMYPQDGTRQTVRTDHYKVEICDDAGNLIEDRFQMEKGKIYTAYWYEGTQYHEANLPAEYPHYRILSTEPAYTIEGTLTKDGYAVYDLSNVPAGLYMVSRNNGLLKIE